MKVVIVRLISLINGRSSARLCVTCTSESLGCDVETISIGSRAFYGGDASCAIVKSVRVGRARALLVELVLIGLLSECLTLLTNRLSRRIVAREISMRKLTRNDCWAFNR